MAIGDFNFSFSAPLTKPGLNLIAGKMLARCLEFSPRISGLLSKVRSGFFSCDTHRFRLHVYRGVRRFDMIDLNSSI